MPEPLAIYNLGNGFICYFRTMMDTEYAMIAVPATPVRRKPWATAVK